MQVTYQVANMDVVGDNDIVVRLHYRVSASQDNCDLLPVRSGVVELEQPSDDIIPFDQITQEIAIGWLKSKIVCAQIEKELQLDIDKFLVAPSVTETQSKLPANWSAD